MTLPTRENEISRVTDEAEIRVSGWRPARGLVIAMVFFAIAALGLGLRGLTNTVEDINLRFDPSNAGTTLDDVEREVVLRFRVPDISVTSLESSLSKGAVTLFDVRTKEEYELGHIPGAIRIDPDVNPRDFLAAHGDRLKDQPAVFYCAVGVRSSRMMSRLLRDVSPVAKAGVHNLRGGAFRWVTAGRQLVAGAEPGQLHPFDDEWEKLLQRTLAAK
jgi:rhodanese-related sulfurtransferase